MNTNYGMVLLFLQTNKNVSQRDIAQDLKISLGKINKIMRELNEKDLIDSDYRVTKKGFAELEKFKPRNAIILAAGLGLRMIPYDTSLPKGLIKIKGEPLIERLITQLNEKGISNITIIVGYMKEKFEYLVDKYDVKLIVNKDYQVTNSLHSLFLVKPIIGNTYIMPCDIWSEHNLFSYHELHSWYSVIDEKVQESCILINAENEFRRTLDSELGNRMIGISYISNEDAKVFVNQIEKIETRKNAQLSYWEEAMFCGRKSILKPKIIKTNIVEINTIEDLNNFSAENFMPKSQIVNDLCEIIHCNEADIKTIVPVKKGMTNRSFSFECRDVKYIMRISGEGTDKLIDREQEKITYSTIRKYNISDEVIEINVEKGYKVTKFINCTRNCNPFDRNDLEKCIKYLKKFHEMKIKVNYEFNIFEKIEYYEHLRGDKISLYNDYESTKCLIFNLKKFIDENSEEKFLAHIDSVSDNFLISTITGDVILIDWEYSAMQDQHVDIAMFAIYSLFNREQIDELIDIYFDGKCLEIVRTKIYAYIAICGFLWSNWCEYKSSLGVEFGEYSLAQYRYAKEYYKIVKSRLKGTKYEL